MHGDQANDELLPPGAGYSGFAPKGALQLFDAPASVDHPPFSVRDWLSTTILKRRFIRNYFAQLDTEYEALCEAKYKNEVSGQVARLRKEYLTQPT